MRAVELTADRALRVASREDPAPTAGEVRLEVAFCGICGTDLQLRDSAAIPTGSVMGHEISGAIAELGPEVEGWAPGDRACVFPFAPCGRCQRCLRGAEHLCADVASTGIGMGARQGGYAEAVVVPHSTLRRLPPGMPAEHGALVEPLAVALHGVALATASSAEPVAVLGGGPIGVMTTLALRLRGFEQIAVVEPNEHRRRRVEALGFATIGLDLEVGARRRELRLRRGLRNTLGDEGPATILDCAGKEGTLRVALDAIRPGGTVVLLSATRSEVSIPLLELLTKEAQIRTSFAYRASEFGEALDLLAAGAVPAEALISAIVPLEEAEEAFDRLARPDTDLLKVLVRPRGGAA